MKNKPFIIGGIIACVLIIGGIIGFILAKGNSGNESLDGIEPVAFEEVSKDDAISEKEYMALLNEAFNYEDSIEYSDNKITGKAAVAKGVDRLGPAYREYLLDGTEDTPQEHRGHDRRGRGRPAARFRGEGTHGERRGRGGR